MLIKYIKKIMEVYPEIKIRLISASTTILTNELYNHKIDVIIDSPPIKINDENKTNTGKWVCPKCGEIEYKSEYYVPMVGNCCPSCEGLLEYKEGC